MNLPDLAAMEDLGARIAGHIQPGDVIALSGGLGTGKTTLARAILRALGHEGEVPSPTFTIIESYDALDPPVVHADFYRLEVPSEVEQLGLDDYREDAVLIAEWPDNAGGFAHEPGCLQIALEIAQEGRLAVVEGGKDWLERLQPPSASQFHPKALAGQDQLKPSRVGFASRLPAKWETSRETRHKK